ncbi:MAG TPA: YceI family protein [Candidatus Krumholzibacteria bacterium]|nr:YceI family protein [Candidatus Krumholzibacteria bacterium]
MKKILSTFGALALVVMLAGQATAATWQIDTTHSTLSFKIRHMLSKTGGQFTDWSGTIEAGDDLTKGSVNIEIQAASIDTRDEKRDEHLRSADFFDVETYPTLTFESTKVEMDGDNYVLHGNLTMHGVTQPVEIPFEFHGTATDPWGNTKAGFSGTVTIDRKDFGIVWNQNLDQGGVVLGDEVEIQIDIAAAKAEAGK